MSWMLTHNSGSDWQLGSHRNRVRVGAVPWAHDVVTGSSVSDVYVYLPV